RETGSAPQGCYRRYVSSCLRLDQDAECAGERDTNDPGVPTSESIVKDEQGVALVGDGDRLSLALSEIGGQCQQCQRGRRDNSCPRKSGNIRGGVSCRSPGGEFLDYADGNDHLRVQHGQQIDAAELVQI